MSVREGGLAAAIKRIASDGRKSAAIGVVAALVAASAVAFAASQAGPSPDERAKMEQVVHDYILAHPEILPQAMKLLQERETAKAVVSNRASIETPFAGAWAGARDADVVLVEFFDYACPYCRASNPDVARLLREDKKLKVVWRELPVLGDDSVAAARVSLAAAKQGRFAQFHDGLYAAGRPTADAVRQAQKAAGVTADPSPEFTREIEKNFELARALNATGTPTFVVGDKVLQGAVGYEALKEAIAQARRKV